MKALPEPYYQDEAVTIYNADCRDILPLLEPVDLVMTDPPYGVDGGRGMGRLRGKANYTDSFADDVDYIKSAVVPVIERLIATALSVVLTPGCRNMCAYPQPDSFGAFWQPAAVGLQTFGNMDAQPIFYYGRNKSVDRNQIMGIPCSYRLTESPEANGHPCPKPLKAWKLLMSNVSQPGQTILDPFLGSGTTARAAKDLGRRCIGIEICEEYCAVAVKRMAQGVLL